MRISDWSSDVCSSDLSTPSHPNSIATAASEAVPTPASTSTGTPAPSTISRIVIRSEEHTSELQSLMRISYAVFCLKKKKKSTTSNTYLPQQTLAKHMTSTTSSSNIMS